MLRESFFKWNRLYLLYKKNKVMPSLVSPNKILLHTVTSWMCLENIFEQIVYVYFWHPWDLRNPNLPFKKSYFRCCFFKVVFPKFFQNMLSERIQEVTVCIYIKVIFIVNVWPSFKGWTLIFWTSRNKNRVVLCIY